MASPLATLDQAVAVEHRMPRADRGRLHIGVEPGEPLPDLGRAPGWLLPLQPHDQGLDLHGELIGMPVRSARAVGQPIYPTVAVALQNLVAGLARDLELLA